MNHQLSYTIGINSRTLTADTVSPALVVPTPVVRTERGINRVEYLSICDLPVPLYNRLIIGGYHYHIH